jgi:hypothetical protein
MELKEVLHYYINVVEYRNRYVDYKEGEWTVWSKLTPGRYGRVMEDHSVSAIQIQLRPLSSITHSEAAAIGYKPQEIPVFLDKDTAFYPNEFHYLLSRGFDLFNLIDAGAAIDSDTLNQQP